MSAYADDARVVIKQKSGNETILNLATNPVITFSGEDMVVTSDLTTLSFPLADIDCYQTYDDATSIEPVAVAPQFSNGCVVFSGLSQGAEAPPGKLSGKK